MENLEVKEMLFEINGRGKRCIQMSQTKENYLFIYISPNVTGIGLRR